MTEWSLHAFDCVELHAISRKKAYQLECTWELLDEWQMGHSSIAWIIMIAEAASYRVDL